MEINCPACDGKGNDGYHKTENCSVCKGTGKVIVDDKKKPAKKK